MHHKIHQCMWLRKSCDSLNECLGDGRVIPVNYEKSIFEHMETEGLSELSNDEIERMQQEKEILAAKECAENVEKRFDGKSCMGTSIHARQPWYSNERKFFFDEQFLLKCAHASSATVLEQCAGKSYFNFLSKFFEEHYILYNNGFEGIRNGCATADKQCSFHKTIGTGALNRQFQIIQEKTDFTIQPLSQSYVVNLKKCTHQKMTN